MASVQETKQSWSEEDDFQLEKSKLDVQVCQSKNCQHLPSQIRSIFGYLMYIYRLVCVQRSAEILRSVRIASRRSVSWTPFQWLWQSANSRSKDLVSFALRLWNTGEWKIKREMIGFIEYLINSWIFLLNSPVTGNPERWSVSPVHSAIQRWAQTGRIFQFPRIGWHYRLSPDSCPWLRRRHQSQQRTIQKLHRHYYDLDLETNLDLPMEQCCNLVK
jgi:hypothetical protein